MTAAELLERIIASGADEKGIRDRFGDNVDLYESCFLEFIEEPSFILLHDAIHTRSYDKALEAAHALKGLSGNLGITGFYEAIRTLSNSLQNAEHDRVDKEYAEVKRQYKRLKHIALDEPMSAQEAVTEELPHPERKHAQISKFRSFLKDKSSRLFLYLLCGTAVAVVAVGLLLRIVNNAHAQNVMQESGQHLKEITSQIKLYIEDHVATDWRITQSVGDSILDSAYTDDDPAIFEMLQKKKTVWSVSDLLLYTENGYNIYADGSTEVADVASSTVYHAREQGKYLSIVESKLFFTVPLDTTLAINGSKIVAISVVRDMSSLLDAMNFSSFGQAAWMYLTDQGGVVLSSLSAPSAIDAYNVQTVIADMEIIPLDQADASEDFLSNPKTSVFLLSNESRTLYGVSAPIMTGTTPLAVFLRPRAIVHEKRMRVVVDKFKSIENLVAEFLHRGLIGNL